MVKQMIGMLSGTIEYKDQEYIIIKTNGGIGFIVYVPRREIIKMQVGDSLSLFIDCKVKEDSLLLFGFPTIEEKECFLHLNKIKGISGKYALRIMGYMSINDIYTAIKNQNTLPFSAIPGIGKKMALRIVSELSSDFDLIKYKFSSQILEDAVSALCNLGHSVNDAHYAVHEVYKENQDIALDVLIKKSLQKMSCV